MADASPEQAPAPRHPHLVEVFEQAGEIMELGREGRRQMLGLVYEGGRLVGYSVQLVEPDADLGLAPPHELRRYDQRAELLGEAARQVRSGEMFRWTPI